MVSCPQTNTHGSILTGAAVDALFATNMLDHNPVPGQVPGLARFKQWMATVQRSFPALRGTVGHVLA